MSEEVKKTDVEALEEAFQQSQEEAKVAAEPPAASPVEEPAPAPTTDKVEEPSFVAEGVESLPEGAPQDMQEEYDKRIKGWQSSYTKKVQQEKSSYQQELAAMKEKYEARFQEALAIAGSQKNASQQTTPPSSDPVEQLLEGADPKQREVFEKVVAHLVNKSLSPLQEKTAQLEKINQANSQQAAVKSQYDEAIQQFPELSKETALNDLTIWAQANTNLAQGKTIGEMYMLKTYSDQRDLGYKKAMDEFKRKEKTALESSTLSNTDGVESIETVEDAYRAALAEAKSKGN